MSGRAMSLFGARKAGPPAVKAERSHSPGKRPTIDYGAVWCDICNKPCGFDETAGHRLWSEPDKEGYTQGYIYLRAYCHEEHADIVVTFEQARHHARQRIVAFAVPGILDRIKAMVLREVIPFTRLELWMPPVPRLGYIDI